jgi:acyl-CoA reductase-like NAD-dependent aldehyde dehydrogenase
MEEIHNIINGEVVEGEHKAYLSSPYDSSQFAFATIASQKQLDSAFLSAKRSIDKEKVKSIEFRTDMLVTVSKLMKKKKDKLTKLLALQIGEPIKFGGLEVDWSADLLSTISDQKNLLEPKHLHSETRRAILLREPVGVVAAMPPWNAPHVLSALVLASSYFSGNGVVVKTPSKAPYNTFEIAKCFIDAGILHSVNVVNFEGRAFSQNAVSNPLTDLLIFFGSSETGKQIAQHAGSNLKRVSLELSGKDGAIILEDADIDKAAKACTLGSFANSGQLCVSFDRIFVEKKIHDDFMQAFVKETRRLRVGNPLDETTDLGPVATQKIIDRIKLQIHDAVSKGGKIRYGNHFENNLVLPTIVDEIDFSFKLLNEESFGPIAGVKTIQNLEEGLRDINNSRHGLRASIYTSDVKRAFSAAETIKVGTVLINADPLSFQGHLPFGGLKESGIGGAKFMIEEMTNKKLILVN